MTDRRIEQERRGGEQFNMPGDDRTPSSRRTSATRRETDRIPVELWIRNTEGIDGRDYSLQQTVNLSAEGVSLRSPYPYNEDTRIHLEILLPNSAYNMQCCGRVRSCVQDGQFFTVGLQLTELAEPDRVAIAALAENLLGETWFEAR